LAWGFSGTEVERTSNLNILPRPKGVGGCSATTTLPLRVASSEDVTKKLAAQRAAERVELSLQRRLAPVFARYLTGRNRAENYRDGILQDAKESLNLTRQGYEAGELDFRLFRRICG
jgi:hypothetical protein